MKNHSINHVNVNLFLFKLVCSGNCTSYLRAGMNESCNRDNFRIEHWPLAELIDHIEIYCLFMIASPLIWLTTSKKIKPVANHWNCKRKSFASKTYWMQVGGCCFTSQTRNMKHHDWLKWSPSISGFNNFYVHNSFNGMKSEWVY